MKAYSFTADNPPVPVTSNKKMKISFRTDKASEGTGFQADIFRGILFSYNNLTSIRIMLTTYGSNNSSIWHDNRWFNPHCPLSTRCKLHVVNFTRRKRDDNSYIWSFRSIPDRCLDLLWRHGNRWKALGNVCIPFHLALTLQDSLEIKPLQAW